MKPYRPMIDEVGEVVWSAEAFLFGLPVVLEPMLPDGVVHRRPRIKEDSDGE